MFGESPCILCVHCYTITHVHVEVISSNFLETRLHSILYNIDSATSIYAFPVQVGMYIFVLYVYKYLD